MQTRVVVGQPWDVQADVLALPIPSDDALPAPVAEVDRRLGGAITAYRTIGELRGKPWSSAMLQGRETGSPWILAMGVGEAGAFDRLTAVRLGGAIERRLTDRVGAPGWPCSSRRRCWVRWTWPPRWSWSRAAWWRGAPNRAPSTATASPRRPSWTS